MAKSGIVILPCIDVQLLIFGSDWHGLVLGQGVAYLLSGQDHLPAFEDLAVLRRLWDVYDQIVLSAAVLLSACLTL